MKTSVFHHVVIFTETVWKFAHVKHRYGRLRSVICRWRRGNKQETNCLFTFEIDSSTLRPCFIALNTRPLSTLCQYLSQTRDTYEHSYKNISSSVKLAIVRPILLRTQRYYYYFPDNCLVDRPVCSQYCALPTRNRAISILNTKFNIAPISKR